MVFVYLVLPETSGRTLEELSFCKSADTFWGGYIVISTTPTVYEDQDVLRHAGVEALHEHRETGTYGTVEDGRGRTGYGE